MNKVVKFQFPIDLEINKARIKPIVIVSGSFLNAILEFSDDAGNILANMEKKTTCRDSIATVSLIIMTGMCRTFLEKEKDLYLNEPSSFLCILFYAHST